MGKDNGGQGEGLKVEGGSGQTRGESWGGNGDNCKRTIKKLKNKNIKYQKQPKDSFNYQEGQKIDFTSIYKLQQFLS